MHAGPSSYNDESKYRQKRKTIRRKEKEYNHRFCLSCPYSDSCVGDGRIRSNAHEKKKRRKEGKNKGDNGSIPVPTFSHNIVRILEGTKR